VGGLKFLANERNQQILLIRTVPFLPHKLMFLLMWTTIWMPLYYVFLFLVPKQLTHFLLCLLDRYQFRHWFETKSICNALFEAVIYRAESEPYSLPTSNRYQNARLLLISSRKAAALLHCKDICSILRKYLFCNVANIFTSSPDGRVISLY
jgi:hypothetical protein